MHLIAIARAAGIILNWDDFDKLSKIIPLLAKIYPNGSADVNHFQAAGGMGVLIAELLRNGLLHEDILTIGDQRGMANIARNRNCWMADCNGWQVRKDRWTNR